MRKLFLIGAAVLFSLLGCVALIKKMGSRPAVQVAAPVQLPAAQPTLCRLPDLLIPCWA